VANGSKQTWFERLLLCVAAVAALKTPVGADEFTVASPGKRASNAAGTAGQSCVHA